MPWDNFKNLWASWVVEDEVNETTYGSKVLQRLARFEGREFEAEVSTRQDVNRSVE